MTKRKVNKVVEPQVKVYNNTKLAWDEIESKPLVGIIKNNWRMRTVYLYQSEESNMLYMVGKSFNLLQIVISYEQMGLNEHNAIDYWKHGQKVYVRD